MLVSFFGHQRKGAAHDKAAHDKAPKPAKAAWAEADQLEMEHGREAAIQLVREQITQVDRTHRKRLYQLHDELVRRYDPARRRG
jgi:hypothetical protein